jgi:hypothetical protein
MRVDRIACCILGADGIDAIVCFEINRAERLEVIEASLAGELWEAWRRLDMESLPHEDMEEDVATPQGQREDNIARLVERMGHQEVRAIRWNRSRSA